jgi:xanthosine phosphorylase
MSIPISDTMAVIRKFAPDFSAKTGIILGSGLGAIAEQLTHPITIPYQAIPGMDASHVAGHASLLVLGYLEGVPIVCLKGRLHLYEGASFASINTLVHIVRQLGASKLIITGAAGSLNPDMNPGDIMVINDHINLQPGNPLVGPNDESVGPRFVSLENAYDDELREVFLRISQPFNIPIKQGIYLSLLGPSFETPAEIRAYRLLGADAVGMSVVPEVIIARHCGLHVTGLAAITNFAVGLNPEKVTHEGTLQHAEIAARYLMKLIPAFVKEIGRDA